jgi:hypothetical protein
MLTGYKKSPSENLTAITRVRRGVSAPDELHKYTNF